MKHGADGLTNLQRRVVEAYLARDSTDGLADVAMKAGIKGVDRGKLSSCVRQILKKPAVQVALRHPPKPQGRKPKVTPKFLRQRARDIVLDPETPKTVLLSTLRFLAEMTPGAIVPVGLNISGRLSIEDFVRAAGGAPKEFQEPVPLQN